MFDVAKNRFALLVEDLRNRQSGVSFDFGVKVDKVPGELAGQQASHGAFARAHKTGQAHQAAFRGRPGHRLLRLEIIRQAIPSASVTLQNLDCTTKGGQLDLGVPFIHGAKEALSILRRGVMTTMRVRLEGRLVDDVAFERGRIHIERIGAAKVDFDRAAEILHDINAAIQETPVNRIFPEEVCTRTLFREGWSICMLPLIEFASSFPAHRVQTSEPSIVLITMYPSTSESWRFAPTVSKVISPCTLSTVTLPESVRTLNSLSTGTVISKSVFTSSADAISLAIWVTTSMRFPACSVSTRAFPPALVHATCTSFLPQAFT